MVSPPRSNHLNICQDVTDDQDDRSGRECMRISSGLTAAPTSEACSCRTRTLVCFNLGVVIFPLYCSYC